MRRSSRTHRTGWLHRYRSVSAVSTATLSLAPAAALSLAPAAALSLAPAAAPAFPLTAAFPLSLGLGGLAVLAAGTLSSA